MFFLEQPGTTRTDNRPLWTVFNEIIFPLVLFFVLGLIHFSPGIWSIPKKIPGIPGDSFYSLWSFWWFNEALTSLQNPFFTDYLHHPHGVWLWFQQSSVFNAVLSIPFQSLLSLNTSYAIVLLGSFVATGMTTFYLIRYVVNSIPCAIVGALTFLLSDIYLAHTHNHIQFTAFQWMPLFILFLLRTKDRQNWADAVWASLFLALASLCSWYQGMFGFLFLVIFVGWCLFDGGLSSTSIPTIGRLCSIGAGTLVFLAPIIIPMIWWKVTGEYTGSHDPVKWSPDLLRFFVPGELSTFGKWLYGGGIDLPGKGGVERSVFFGWLTLGLGLYGSSRSRTTVWQIAFAVFFLLALGPYLKLFGTVTVVSLPYELLFRYLPFFSFAGMPVRFSLMAQLMLAVLAGFGFKEIMAQVEESAIFNCSLFGGTGSFNVESLPTVVGVFLLGCFGLLLWFAHTTGPYPSFGIRGEGAYHWLAQREDKSVILDLSWPTRSASLYHQTIHGHRIIDGPLSRYPREHQEFLRNRPIFGELLHNRNHSVSKLKKRVLPGGKATLDRFGVRYVVIHSQRLSQTFGDVLNLEPAYESSEADIFRIQSP